MTQLRIVISASDIPWALRMKALRVRTWPIHETKTVTKDISMVLAKRAASVVAVEGESEAPEAILWPHRGWRMAVTSQMPLPTVE